MTTQLQKQLKDKLKLSVEFGLDIENNIIEVLSDVCWSDVDKDSYYDKQNKIQSYSFCNDLVTIIAWCDISGFDYWSREDELNYVVIDVKLLNDSYTDDEIGRISACIEEVNDYFHNILQ